LPGSGFGQHLRVLDAMTIVAVASASGPGYRRLIRLSGSRTGAALGSLGIAWTGQRGCGMGVLDLGEGRTLAAQVMRSVGPASATGEDCADVLIPSSETLAAWVMSRLLSGEGVREAAPGEFLARGYCNGKITLDQAEGVARTIAARGEAELASAGRLRSGAFGREARAWADELADCLALVEAGIDFSDQEDVVAIEGGALRERVSRVRGAMASTLRERGSRAVEGRIPVVALVGAPSAGKTTLLNRIVGFERGVTDPAPGTTRDALVEEITLPGGSRVALVDLPGIAEVTASGSGRNVIEKEGDIDIDSAAMALARARAGEADLLVLCDPVGKFLSWPQREDGNTTPVRVRTMADLPGAIAEPSGRHPGEIAVCALDGTGVGALLDAIERGVMGLAPSAHEVIGDRIERACARAIENLAEVASDALAPELAASSLRAALDDLGELVGVIPPDEVLGRIFAGFCVGK